MNTPNQIAQLEIDITHKHQRILRFVYWSLVPVLLLTIGLAWAFYPEPYPFFRTNISKLGGYFSHNEFLSNHTSMIIMTIGFTLLGIITLVAAIFYFLNSHMRYFILKGILNLILTIGAIGIALPQDHPTLRFFHGLGAALFIVGFGVLNFSHQLLRYIRKHQNKPTHNTFDYYLDLTIAVIVFVTLLIFLIIFPLSTYTTSIIITNFSTASQKLVLIVDCIAILLLDIDDM